MEKFIAFSGGVESTTMCVLFGANAKAIFADAGWEHKHMYERIERVEKEVKKLHPNFEVIKIKSEKGRLQDYIAKQKFYPSPLARYCTRIFKIEPMDKWLSERTPCELMIGLNADEVNRAGNHQKAEGVNYIYPLIEAGLSREKCKMILSRANLLPELPPYMQRGGCIGCFFKSKKEFAAMAMLNPDEFKEVEDLEKAMQDKRGKYYAIRDNIGPLSELRKMTESSLFEADEMYIGPDDVTTPCGIYCHR